MRRLCRRSASLIEDDADVLGHRDDHLPVVLGLGLLAALELDARQLRDAVDELRDLVAELVAHVVDVRLGVLDDVVEERGGDRLLVEPQLGADPRDADGMLDERPAGAALLPLVRRRGEAEGPRDELAVDRAPRRGDLGEQLVEEALVLFACLERGHRFSVLPASRGVSPRKERTFTGRIDIFHAQNPPPERPQDREARARSRSDRRLRAHGSAAAETCREDLVQRLNGSE